MFRKMFMQYIIDKMYYILVVVKYTNTTFEGLFAIRKHIWKDICFKFECENPKEESTLY